MQLSAGKKNLYFIFCEVEDDGGKHHASHVTTFSGMSISLLADDRGMCNGVSKKNTGSYCIFIILRKSDVNEKVFILLYT